MTLFTQSIQDHLTVAPVDAAARQTFPGMAHFAGTGPNATCRECSFWHHAPYDYHSKTGKHHGLIKPATCDKYRQMMRSEVGAKIPDDARACKYFEARQDVPARYSR